ncbi:MAG: hypothetical protein WBE20_15165 [Candidatus Acidiferrales bacterium]
MQKTMDLGIVKMQYYAESTLVSGELVPELLGAGCCIPREERT